jgi:phosphate acetyltransferase
VKLGGQVDAVVFTGGIGEGDVEMREDILEGLQENLQIGFDHAKNKNAVGADVIMEIHPAFSKTQVLVVPTDEEISIAIQSSELVIPKEKVEPVAFIPLSQVKTNLFCHSLGNTYTASEEVGLLSIFAASVDKIGYFRPIARESRGPADYRVQLMKEHFGLTEQEESEMYGVNQEEALRMISDGEEDQLIERIIQKYLAYSSKRDFVLVSSFTDSDDSLHWAGKLCSTFNIPAIVMGDKSHSSNFGIAQTAFESHGAEVLGVIVSDVDIDDVVAVRTDFVEHGLKPLALIPKSPVLSKRTVREVLAILDDGVCLYGAEHLDMSIDKMLIHTMQVKDLLHHMHEGQLAIMSANRIDAAMSLLLAAQSSNASDIAGILFTLHKTGDLDPTTVSILNGLSDIRIPIIATSLDTFGAAKKIEETPAFITAESKEKINTAVRLVEENLDFSLLEHFESDAHIEKKPDIRPRLFQYSAFQQARQLQKTIVLPEGADPRVVKAAAILVQRKLCNVILVGNSDIIQKNAEKARVSLDGITICDPHNYDGMKEMVDLFVDARKSKGLTHFEAENFLLQDVNYFGTLMMHMGIADGMVSGAMHSSANTIRPALQVLKTAPGASIVSSIFFMLLEDGVKVFGDCAINVDPTAEQLAEIAVASAKSSIQFGMDPRVALLSYATGDSNSGDAIDKVIKATALAKKIAEEEGFMDPTLIEGPLQFDAAVDPAIADVKTKDSLVAGRANV